MSSSIIICIVKIANTLASVENYNVYHPLEPKLERTKFRVLMRGGRGVTKLLPKAPTSHAAVLNVFYLYLFIIFLNVCYKDVYRKPTYNMIFCVYQNKHMVINL